MKYKNTKTTISVFTALIFSLSLSACAPRQGTNPPPSGRTGQNNITRNGRMGANLNPDGTLNNTLDTTDLDNGNMGRNNIGTNPTDYNNNLGNNTIGYNNNAGNNNMAREGMQESTTRDDSGSANINTTNNDMQRAATIERAVNSIKGVRSSRVIVTGNRALVGIDMGSTAQGTMTTQLKDNVDRVVKSADRRIQTVAVTADADMFRRITSVGEGIRAGRPFSQFGAEVEEIFRRIIPR